MIADLTATLAPQTSPFTDRTTAQEPTDAQLRQLAVDITTFAPNLAELLVQTGQQRQHEPSVQTPPSKPAETPSTGR